MLVYPQMSICFWQRSPTAMHSGKMYTTIFFVTVNYPLLTQIPQTTFNDPDCVS